jgi:predicted CXXCH cytochrome family protein
MAEATGLAGEAGGEGEEDTPAQAFIKPYGIYPDSHVLDIAEFEQPDPFLGEGWTYTWSLAVPEGSAAELLAHGPVAIFMADVEGQYDLTLAVVDPEGFEAETTWAVTATTYIGGETCVMCHSDQAALWQETGHASILTHGLNGTLSAHYSEGCISCHTTGFDPLAENGGFDDLMAEYGREFPEELVEGTWDAFVDEYPEVAALGNIQCESCHGPGGAHMGQGPIGTSLEAGVCATCHGEETHHVFPMQWENSGHAEGSAWWAEVGRTECARCHSGDGFIDYVSGVPEEEWRSGPQNLSCASCHDPHDASNPSQLRVYDEVTMPDGTVVTDAGPSATCMTCHNGRREGGAAGQVASGVAGEGMKTPHHNQAAAELLLGGGGYTWGETLPSSAHVNVVEDTCVTCHMNATPGFDADGNPLPGRHTVGGHSFAVVSEEAGENLVACKSCHSYIESFEFRANADYDGDGEVENHEAEIEGLLELLVGALEEAGVVDPAGRQYSFADGVEPTEELYGAIYNYQFSLSSGAAYHNFRYVTALLQLSYEKVTGNPVPGAAILSP